MTLVRGANQAQIKNGGLMTEAMTRTFASRTLELLMIEFSMQSIGRTVRLSTEVNSRIHASITYMQMN